MTVWIQAFRRNGALAGSPLPLIDLAAEFVVQLQLRTSPDARLTMELFEVSESAEISGDPTLYHLTSNWGYARLTVFQGQQIIYSHPHRLSELVAAGLRKRLLALDPDESWWAFALCEAEEAFTHLEPGELERLWARVRPTPQSEGTMTLDHSSDPTVPKLRIRPVPPLPLPELNVSSLSTTLVAAGTASVSVLMSPAVYAELKVHQAFSRALESGGFLVGTPYQVQGEAKRYAVVVTGALPAEHTGASFLHFTFTGDSFAAVKQTLRQQRPLDRLVGWYHTHLFPAREEMGLSTVDVQLHRVTFQQPWQLAGLVNLSDEERVVRCYVREGIRMLRCPILLLHGELPHAIP